MNHAEISDGATMKPTMNPGPVKLKRSRLSRTRLSMKAAIAASSRLIALKRSRL